MPACSQNVSVARLVFCNHPNAISIVNSEDTADDPELLLQVKGLSKSFPGVQALDQVDLELKRGEVLAVIGENGAGKSTLMKILAGVQPADEGTINMDGQITEFGNTRSAMEQGIVLIHQELNLCDNLNVGQNIFLGREPRRYGLIDNHRISRESEVFLKRVGLGVAPSTLVSKLPIGKRQMVEIAKALSIEARILIMDEPTSSLSVSESELLFELIADLKEQGVAIIYISHRLAEVKRLADRIVVLRDGKNAGQLAGAAITQDNMVRLMVGRDVSSMYVRVHHSLGDPVIEVDHLVTPAWPDHAVSLTVRAGEIVGLAGLVGAGRTELLRVLFGVDRAVAGEIRMAGIPVQLQSCGNAIDNGIALVPEDRKAHGILLDLNVRNNIGLPGLMSNRRAAVFADLGKQRQIANEMIDLLGVKTPSPTQVVKFLSGGNQQKVAIAKWLAMSPKLLLLDEPTRGIDIGAKQEIYQLIEKLASDSLAILFASSEMEEILGLSDRVYVMHEGRINGQLERNEMTEEAIMQLATAPTQFPQEASA